MAISLVALFENRSSAIQNNKFRITKKRWKLLYYSVNCFIVLVYLIPPYCNVPEQESAKLHLLQVSKRKVMLCALFKVVDFHESTSKFYF